MPLHGDGSFQTRELRNALSDSRWRLTDFWLHYFALGGSAGGFEIEAYVFGAHMLPALECDMAAAAMNEHSMESGLPARVPHSEPPQSSAGWLDDLLNEDKGTADMDSIDTDTGSEYSVADELQDLVLDSADVVEFLEDLAAYSATSAPGVGQMPVQCAITLYRRHRPLTGAGSDESATIFDRIQQKHGAGPCLEALETGHTVVMDDAATDPRWPEYAREMHALEINSVLAVPMPLEGGAAAAMNFFSPVKAMFTPAIIERAENYASSAQKALRLAVRIGSRDQAAVDLQEAMKSRTAIDIAIGVIMGQQRCSQDDAFALLVKASSSRNQKLRDLAEELVTNLNNKGVQTHFDA